MKKAKVSAKYDGGSMTEEEARRARMNARARKAGHKHVMTGKPRRKTRRQVNKSDEQLEFKLEELLTIPDIIVDGDHGETMMMIEDMKSDEQWEFELEGFLTIPDIIEDDVQEETTVIKNMEGEVAYGDHQAHAEGSIGSAVEVVVVADDHQVDEPVPLRNEWEGQQEEEEAPVWWEEYWPEKCCWSYEEGWRCSCDNGGGGGGVTSGLDHITGNVADEEPWEDDIWNLRSI